MKFRVVLRSSVLQIAHSKRETLNKFANYIGAGGTHLVLSGQNIRRLSIYRVRSLGDESVDNEEVKKHLAAAIHSCAVQNSLREKTGRKKVFIITSGVTTQCPSSQQEVWLQRVFYQR